MSTAAEVARSGPLAQPRICCLDLDTFFVSVERAPRSDAGGQAGRRGRPAGQPRRGDRGQLRGAPAGREVGHVADRGGQAGAATPSTCRPAATTYGDYAERVREIARRYSPVVLVASIDEMFLDFSGCERLYGAAPATPRRATSPSSARSCELTARSTRARPARERRHRHQQGDGEGGVQRWPSRAA